MGKVTELTIEEIAREPVRLVAEVYVIANTVQCDTGREFAGCHCHAREGRQAAQGARRSKADLGRDDLHRMAAGLEQRLCAPHAGAQEPVQRRSAQLFAEAAGERSHAER